jgi:leader peptidase (prepilin peptidase)/N-methyltransferase
LTLSDPVLVLAVAIVGLAIGSFLNVVIHRLPRMMEAEWKAQCAELAGAPAAGAAEPPYNLVVPRSHCPQCKTPLRVADNIPLVSWFALRGRCKHCGARIPARYPVVEALTALLSAAIAVRFGFTAATLLALVFTWTLVALTFIDADTTLLPDDLTLPLLWLGLGANVFGTFAPLKEAVIGAMAGDLALWSIYWLFKLVTGKEGMGYGDFKLLAALGAWMGWKSLLPIVLLSSLVGAVVGIVLIVLARRGREIPIPFGPYLAAAGFIVLLAGDALTRWFMPL